MNKIKEKSIFQILLCVFLFAVFLTGCGDTSKDKEFLANYEYVINNAWLHEENSGKYAFSFEATDRNKDGNLCGKMTFKNIQSDTPFILDYEIAEINEDEDNKFLMIASSTGMRMYWELTVNREDNNVICTDNNGNSVEWKSISSIDEPFAGAINLGENYTDLTHSLWSTSEYMGSTILFMPASDKETSGSMGSILYSYEVLETLEGDTLLLLTRDTSTGYISKSLLTVDREKNKMYIKNQTEIQSFDLCTPKDSNDSLSIYEYVTNNLWYWNERSCIFHIQSLTNEENKRQGIFGELFASYEVICADETAITLEIVDMMVEEVKCTMRYELGNDSKYLNAEDLISGGYSSYIARGMDELLDFNVSSTYTTENTTGEIVFLDNEIENQYEYILNTNWSDGTTELRIVDKGVTANQEMYGEVYIDNELRSYYFLTDVSRYNYSADAYQINFNIEWIEDGEFKVGCLWYFKNADSATLEWRETVNGTHRYLGVYDAVN